MSTDSFFGGAPALSFKDPSTRGRIRGGLIVDEPQIQDMTEMGTGKPLLWPDGRPKQQMVVTLLCDGRGGALVERDPQNPSDDGRRRLYIKGYMTPAVGEAIRTAGVPGLRQGGELYVAWVDEKPSKTKGNHDAKIYAAKYTPPMVGLPDGAQSQPQNGLSGAPSANPFGGPAVTGPPVQQPAQAPQQQPVLAQPSGPPANPFGGAPAQQPAAPGGYDPNQYRPPAQPNPFGQPAQQPAPTGAPPANPFG